MSPQLNPDRLRDFNRQHRDLAIAIQHAASELDQSITVFLAEPTSERLIAAQEKWYNTALPIQSFGLIKALSEQLPTQLSSLSKQLDLIAAQPITPGFIDSYQSYQFSGLVNDMSAPLSKAQLLKQHHITDNSEVIVGLHAISYLLFGDAFGSPASPSRFLAVNTLSSKDLEMGYSDPKELPINRRRHLLALQSRLLVEHTQELASLWHEKSELVAEWQTLDNELQRLALVASLDQLKKQTDAKKQQFAQNTFSYDEGVNPVWQLAPQETKQRFLVASDSAINMVEVLLKKDDNVSSNDSKLGTQPNK